jgi:hypothetical protein
VGAMKLWINMRNQAHHLPHQKGIAIKQINNDNYYQIVIAHLVFGKMTKTA